MKSRRNIDIDELSRRERMKIESEVHELFKSLEGVPGLEDELAEKSGVSARLDLGTLSERDLVEQRFNDWKTSNFEVPNRKYKDHSLIIYKVRKKFLEYLRDLVPEAIEELRPLTQLYKSVVGDQVTQSNMQFQRVFENFYDPAISFRNATLYEYSKLNLDYIWGEYRPLIKLICRDFGAEHRVGQNLQSREIIEFGTTNEYEYYVRRAESEIAAAFAIDLTQEPERVTNLFLLIEKLIEWVEKYSLGTDWMMWNAIEFVRQMHYSPAIAISDIQILSQHYADLEGPKFKFEFRGWNAGTETPDEYEQRIKYTFRNEFSKYLRETYLVLELENIQESKKPINLNRVRWLVRRYVQAWTIHEIANEYGDMREGGISNSAVSMGLREFGRYGFPKFKGVA